MDLSLATFVFTLRMTADIADQYALFRLKRPFQEAFQVVASCVGKECDCCLSGRDRACTHAFASPLATDPAALRRHQKSSPPFVFHVSLLPSPPNKGFVVELGLTLIGSAVAFASEYISAVRHVFADSRRFRLPFEIIKVEFTSYGDQRSPLKIQQQEVVGGLVVVSSDGLIKGGNLNSSYVPLHIVTPLRLLEEGRVIGNVSASHFLRALMRRVSSIAYYYGGVELDIDFKWLARLADQIVWVDGAFTWHDGGPAFSGITGSAVLHGELSEFHQFLLLGEYFHLGKGATYGLGRFHLSPQKDYS